LNVNGATENADAVLTIIEVFNTIIYSPIDSFLGVDDRFETRTQVKMSLTEKW
jgi:hypothetical protein